MPRRFYRRPATVAGALWLASSLALSSAPASGGNDFSVSGKLAYTGSLGPVSGTTPLCLCIYTDAALTNGIGCVIRTTNNSSYRINAGRRTDYYLIAFLDLHLNERLDPDEPFEIYRDRATPPADAVSTATAPADIDFIFGDENLPGAPTPTAIETSTPTATSIPTETPTVEPTATEVPTATDTPTASATPTETGTPALRCEIGDCDDGGTVTVDEILAMVNIALGLLDFDSCVAGDGNGDRAVQVDEIVRAIQLALIGCGSD